MDTLKLKAIFLFILAFFNLVLAFFLWRKGKGNKAAFHLGFMAFFSALYVFTCGGTDFFGATPLIPGNSFGIDLLGWVP